MPAYALGRIEYSTPYSKFIPAILNVLHTKAATDPMAA